MLRFSKNRWWAFVLALSVFTVCLFALGASAPTRAHATVDGGPSMIGDPTPPNGFGDPDVPIGGAGLTKDGRGKLYRGGMQPGTISTARSRPTGEGRVLQSALYERIRLVLLSLKLYYMRF